MHATRRCESLHIGKESFAEILYFERFHPRPISRIFSENFKTLKKNSHKEVVKPHANKKIKCEFKKYSVPMCRAQT